MFRIGEFSKITQVSIRMLRYYDENGLLVPAKVETESGYRLYSSSQIEHLNKIIFLKDLGFSVKKIKIVLENWNTEQIKSELLQQQETIRNNIKEEQEKLLRIQISLKDLEKQTLSLNTQIVIKSLPSVKIMSIRRILPDYSSEWRIWKELSEMIPDANHLSSFSIYHDLDYKEIDVDIEACVILDDVYNCKREGVIVRNINVVTRAACFLIYGPYENIDIAYKEFGVWLEKHPEYRMCGENRQVCHISPCDTNNPQEYITELQVPIKMMELQD